MNNVRYNLPSGTFSHVIAGVVSGVFAAHMLHANATNNLTEHVNRPLKPSFHSWGGNKATFNKNISITGEYGFAPLGFEKSVSNFYARLLVNQEPLGAEFEKVLQENLWDLYES